MKVFPKVSVITITYGHETYIKDTLIGILTQNYPGEIEFIIANDCSPDGTDKVIKDYFLNNSIPNNFIIKYTNHKINKGIVPNFIWALKEATGKYVALCEGDDYWIEGSKLHKQVSILENNPKINICSHPSKRRYGDLVKNDSYGYWGEDSKIINTKEVIQNYASTAPFQSIMFRNENIKELELIIKQLLGAHSTIQIFYSIPNGLYYLPEYMSVYRVESSSSVSKTLFKKDGKYLDRQIINWKGLDLLNNYSKFKFNNAFIKSKRNRAFSVISIGYLSWGQTMHLILKYELFKQPKSLLKVLKIKTHTFLGVTKNKIINYKI